MNEFADLFQNVSYSSDFFGPGGRLRHHNENAAFHQTKCLWNQDFPKEFQNKIWNEIKIVCYQKQGIRPFGLSALRILGSK